MMCEKAVQWWRGRHLFAIILIYISAEDAWAVGNNIYDYAHIRCVFYSHKLHTENATLWGAVKHRRNVHCFYGGGGKLLSFFTAGLCFNIVSYWQHVFLLLFPVTLSQLN